MNIIELAKEAGFVVQIHGECFGHTTLEHRFNPDRLEAFAALVRAEALAEPVKQEPVAWKRESDGVLFSFEVYEGLTPLYAAPVDAKVIREERDSMWLAQMEFEEKRVRAEALEEAAKLCEDRGFDPYIEEQCAAAIRGLK
jgi:hypothetical protein